MSNACKTRTRTRTKPGQDRRTRPGGLSWPTIMLMASIGRVQMVGGANGGPQPQLAARATSFGLTRACERPLEQTDVVAQRWLLATPFGCHNISLVRLFSEVPNRTKQDTFVGCLCGRSAKEIAARSLSIAAHLPQQRTPKSGQSRRSSLKLLERAKSAARI